MAVDQNAERQRTKKESAAGTKAARTLRTDLRRAVSRFKEDTGTLKTIGASKRMRKGQLRGIAIKSPIYGYMNHYGYIGTKSNGVFQRLKATGFINDAIEKGSIETLATEISEIRAEEIVANFKFR
tara:strand:+ start:5770 stop:6147 length:378 start_codon:yes stop_codon:yes gene_type:complete